MSKNAATLESPPDSAISQDRRARKPRARSEGARGSAALTPQVANSGGFRSKPLLVGVGIGAALALTGVALASRPARPAFGSRPPSVVGALTQTAVVLLARIVIRKALAAAAQQGARKLASAWHW